MYLLTPETTISYAHHAFLVLPILNVLSVLCVEYLSNPRRVQITSAESASHLKGISQRQGQLVFMRGPYLRPSIYLNTMEKFIWLHP